MIALNTEHAEHPSNGQDLSHKNNDPARRNVQSTPSFEAAAPRPQRCNVEAHISKSEPEMEMNLPMLAACDDEELKSDLVAYQMSFLLGLKNYEQQMKQKALESELIIKDLVSRRFQNSFLLA